MPAEKNGQEGKKKGEELSVKDVPEKKEKEKKVEDENQSAKEGDGDNSSDSGSTYVTGETSPSSGTGSTVTDGKNGDKSNVARKGSAPSQQRGQRNGGGRGADTLLESITLELRNGRRLFVDVRENWRGKFMKLAEMGGRVSFRSSGGGRASRVTMPLKTASQCADRLADISDVVEELGEKDCQSDGKRDLASSQTRSRSVLHSAVVIEDSRRYFLDLLPSRFQGRDPVLRIKEHGQMLSSSITIESSDVDELKEAITTLLGKHYDENAEVEKPQKTRSLRFGRRHFYFDPVHNHRGQSVRISEVFNRADGRMERNAVTVPDKMLTKFAEVLSHYDVELNDQKHDSEDGGSEADVQGNKPNASNAGNSKEQPNKEKKKGAVDDNKMPDAVFVDCKA